MTWHMIPPIELEQGTSPINTTVCASAQATAAKLKLTSSSENFLQNLGSAFSARHGGNRCSMSLYGSRTASTLTGPESEIRKTSTAFELPLGFPESAMNPESGDHNTSISTQKGKLRSHVLLGVKRVISGMFKCDSETLLKSRLTCIVPSGERTETGRQVLRSSHMRDRK